MSFPTDDELLEAITALRPLHPKLGRKQFRALLKDTYSWERLSETRLKKVLDENDLNATPLIKNTTPETLERDEKFKAVVKNAFLDFKVRERDFFMGLKSRQAKILGGGTYVGRLRRSTYLRHHVEFLLTMKEIKPCTLFTHTCVRNSWVFADTRSPLWSDVNETFLTPHEKKTSEDCIAKALGYPMKHATGELTSTFRAMDDTESKQIQPVAMNETSLVRGFEFRCGSGIWHFMDIFAYMHRCVVAAAEVGTRLRMQLVDFEAFANWVTRIGNKDPTIVDELFSTGASQSWVKKWIEEMSIASF